MTRATSSAGKGAARAAHSADAPLRRDIRLLGNVLGRIVVEQAGQESEAERELVRRPLLRSIAGIAAALRNTG